jgi:anaerobic ribonucleoside-triphosphate reductase activating protein
MLKIAGMVSDSITDGPGLRTAIFFQGCDKDCEGCHNPEARKMDGGSEISAEEILETIRGNILTSGVTFTGGEPLLQATEIIPLAKKIRELNLDIALYTGDTVEKIFAGGGDKLELLRHVDTIIDGPFLIKERSLALPFRGSTNQRILDAKKTMAEGRAVIDTSEKWNPA